MSYCTKEIKCGTIDILPNRLIEITLDNCEANCDRYFQCDTVAYMNDKLKENYDE